MEAKPSRAKSKYTVHLDSAQATCCADHHPNHRPGRQKAVAARHVRLSTTPGPASQQAHLVITGPARGGWERRSQCVPVPVPRVEEVHPKKQVMKRVR